MNKWQTRENEVDLRLGLVADAHIAPQNNPARVVSETDGRHLEEAFRAFLEIGKSRLDGVLMVGDIVYQNIKDELYPSLYDLLADKISILGDTPVLYAAGNHEFPQGCTDAALTEKARKLFIEKTGSAQNFVKKINGFTFVAIGCVDYYCSYVGKETESWALSEIDKAIKEDPKSPVFLLTHIPIYGTNFFRDMPCDGNETFSEEFFAALKSRPQLIVLCAHCHTAAQLPQNLWQGGFSSYHIPMCSGGCLSELSCDPSGAYHNHEAAILEVSRGVVKIFGIDLVTGKYTGEPFEINIKGIAEGSDTFNYSEDKYEKTNAPYFEEGDKISFLNIADTQIVISFPRGKIEPTGKLCDNFIRAHRIIVTEKETGKEALNLLYQSDFWNYDPPKYLTRVLSNLHYETNYEISISPMSPYGVFGKPITAEFKTI